MNKFNSDSKDLCKANDDLSCPFEGFNEGVPKTNHFFFPLAVSPNMDQSSVYVNNDLPGTGVVRLGDIDLDGYLDLSISFSEGDKVKTYFFKNSECNDDAKKIINPTGAQVNYERCRYFKRTTDMATVESATVYSSSFFDYHELG